MAAHAGLSLIHNPHTPHYRKRFREDFYEAQCWEVSLCLDDAVHYSRPEHYCKGSSQRLAIRATCTQENKEVYKPACGDDCPTVPETTEAYCGSSQWQLSLCNVKNPAGHSAQQSGQSWAGEPIFSSQSIWPNTNSPSLAWAFLTAGVLGGKTTTTLQLFPFPLGGGGGLHRYRSAPWVISTQSLK